MARASPDGLRWMRLLGGLARSVVVFAVALILFGLILVAAGKDPVRAILETLRSTLGTGYGLSEVLVKMTPLLLTAVAVALPSRLGLINVGGEGQLYMGACFGTWVALSFPPWPAGLLLPSMLAMGMLGGGLWALLPAWLRARGLVNETITTLLMNYVAPSIATFLIYGPWRSPFNSMYPQTVDFVEAARLPTLFDTRVHVGLIAALALVALYGFVMRATRWGVEIRAIGGNPQAARRCGIPVPSYIVAALCLGGAAAGLAGIVEVAGLHGRLRPGFSPGFGYMGFLISWLSFGNPIGMVVMSFVAAVISLGGDVLQIKQGLPYAVVNILLALTLYVVLARPSLPRRRGA